MTQTKRRQLNIPKTHANDAYAMGDFHPKHKARPTFYKKRRRNNRILEKFYDAKYIDIRDGKTKKASELCTNRTNRSIPRNNSQNERKYRGAKISKGRRNIRTQRYALQPNTIIKIDNKKYTVKGIISNGQYVTVQETQKTFSTNRLQITKYAAGWIKQ